MRRVARSVCALPARLTPPEDANVRFAVQLAFGLINNTILNRPGPFFLEQELFVENLVRAFQLVSGYDDSRSQRKRANQARRPRQAQAETRRPPQTTPGGLGLKITLSFVSALSPSP